MRPSDFGLTAFVALGSDAVTGTGPYVHTLTPANSPPYLTAWKNVGAGTIVDQYTDVRISSLELSGGAGQALACKTTMMGLGAAFGATDGTAAVVSETPFTYPQASLSLGGTDPLTVEQLTVTMNNNAEYIQADNSVGPYDVVLGRLVVDGTFTYLLQSDADYRKFHTGSATGTAFTTTLFSQAIALNITDGTNIINVSTTGAAYTAYPVPPDVSGKPIKVAATWAALPQPTIAAYLTIKVTNSVATY